MTPDPRVSSTEAIAQLAVARGYLSPVQLEEARRLAAGGDLLRLLASRYLRPEHVADLRSAYANGSGRLEQSYGSLPAGAGRYGSDTEATIRRAPPSASRSGVARPVSSDSEITVRRPPPSASDSLATIHHPPPSASASSALDSEVTVRRPPPSASATEATVRRQPPAGSVDARPDSVGPYSLVRELARGGMGVVYVARRPGLDRDVAIKVLLPGAELSGDAIQRFQIEANVAARLRHPNIVGIHDVGEDRGKHYLAMDLIQGESLQAQLKREGPLKPRAAARLTAKLAAALAYSHRRAVLHRDIKPHNVLIDEAGEPLLTDFGLAKDVGEEEGLTKTGQVMGTPAYMPPEQADGDLDRIDRRSDVYSLGATLYHMLTGRPPFQGTSALNLIRQVLSEDPRPPRQLRAEVPADLNTICLKALEKQPRRATPRPKRCTTTSSVTSRAARSKRGLPACSSACRSGRSATARWPRSASSPCSCSRSAQRWRRFRSRARPTPHVKT